MADIIKHALYDSLKRIYCADTIFSGDISFAGKKEAKRTLEYIKAYDYIFHRKNDIFIGDLDTFHEKDAQQFQNLQLERAYDFTRFKQKMIKKTMTNSHVAVSFINESKPLVEDWRIISASFVNVVDLGDTRNFKNIDECIDKIKLIENATCYVGSLCSWHDIAVLYNKPAISIGSH